MCFLGYDRVFINTIETAELIKIVSSGITTRYNLFRYTKYTTVLSRWWPFMVPVFQSTIKFTVLCYVLQSTIKCTVFMLICPSEYNQIHSFYVDMSFRIQSNILFKWILGDICIATFFKTHLYISSFHIHHWNHWQTEIKHDKDDFCSIWRFI